jgi:aryl-alcohol dehydrogenase-like predicted oxidoreductase
METATTTGQITIGQGGIATAPLGVGTWAWGDSRLWGYGKGYGREDLTRAFEASVAAGVTLFDTAEIYGRGESERILGALVRATSTSCSVFLRGFVAQFSCYDAKNTTEELPARCTRVLPLP